MVYSPTTWQDSPSTATAITAARLNKMETGIDQAHDHVADNSVHLTAEQVRDLVATFVTAGSNVTVTHSDAGDTLTIAASGAGGGLTQEQVEDIVNTLIVAGTNITKTYDDTAGTLTLAASGAGGGLTQEQVEDIVNTLVVAGTNITKTYDDVAGTLTISSTGAGLTQEQVEDAVNTLIVAGTNITKTYDDVAGTLTIAASAPLDPNYTRIYTYLTDTTTTEPGSGIFKVNSGTAASITTLVISENDGNSASAVNWLDNFRAGDILEFVLNSDATKWWRVQIVSVVDNGTWRTYTVSNGVAGPSGMPGGANYVNVRRTPAPAAASSLTQEQVEDVVNTLIVAGTNITKTYDDAAGTLTLAAAGGSGTPWTFSTTTPTGGANGDVWVQISDTGGSEAGRANVWRRVGGAWSRIYEGSALHFVTRLQAMTPGIVPGWYHNSTLTNAAVPGIEKAGLIVSGAAYVASTNGTAGLYTSPGVASYSADGSQKLTRLSASFALVALPSSGQFHYLGQINPYWYCFGLRIDSSGNWGIYRFGGSSSPDVTIVSGGTGAAASDRFVFEREGPFLRAYRIASGQTTIAATLQGVEPATESWDALYSFCFGFGTSSSTGGVADAKFWG